MTHSLDSKIRNDHRRTAIRGTAHATAPESLTRTATGDVVALHAARADRRPSRPVRDGVTRVGAMVPLDQDHRASLGKVLASLGWDKTTTLVAEIEGHTAVVRVGERTRQAPWLTRVRAASGRMTLPPPVTGALGLDAGDQVLAIALPDRGELRLLAAADGLQELTGALAPRDVPAREAGRR